MEDKTDLLDIFLNLPERNELEAYLKALASGKQDEHYLRFRYGVSRATLVHDLVFNWEHPSGGKGGWSAKVEKLAKSAVDKWTEAVPASIQKVFKTPARQLQLSRLLPQDYVPRTAKIDRERYTIREIWKVELIASIIVSHWRSKGLPFCQRAGTECLCEFGSDKFQVDPKRCREFIKNTVLDYLAACPLSNTTDGNSLRKETFLGLPLGISTKHYVEHAAQEGMHILIPVNPKPLVKWNEKDFAETFDVLREHYLKRTQASATKVVYVLRPEHSYQNPDLNEWLVGEGHYRVQMERLLRDDSDVSSKIVWFVSDERKKAKTAKHVSMLFPEKLPQPWKDELDIFFSVWDRKVGQYQSAYSDFIYTATVQSKQSGRPVSANRDMPEPQIRFAVSPIAETRFRGLYKTPVIPLEKAGEDSNIRASVAEFVSKAIAPDRDATVGGWKKLTLHQFLALPGDRNLQA